MHSSFLIAVLFLFIWVVPSADQPDEIIRRKLENASIKDVYALGAELRCTAKLSDFYLNRSFEPYWSPKAAGELVKSLQSAEEEGLQSGDYHLAMLLEHMGNNPMSAEVSAEYDLLLTDAFLLYTSHLLSGKVNPQTIDAEWHVVPGEGNPVGLLEEALNNGKITHAVQKAMPNHSFYQNLKKALKAYRALDDSNWPTVGVGPTIKSEMEDNRLPDVRQRLHGLGDLENPGLADNYIYDEKTEAAVKRFQLRHGLESDGSIGIQTLAALNVSVASRIEQIEANMERWRWLSREFGDFYLKVNIASFELDVVKNGQTIRTHKVITGKPFRKTPVFSSKMDYLVFNPTWTIPPGILNADVIPGMRKDSTYLKKKNIEVFDRAGNVVDVSQVDWSNNEVKGYTYRQPAGIDNSLGAVKFMFPNNFHVYLHDTPAKELFAKSERAFSSGCIRVQDPLALAEYIINDSENWNKAKIESVVATRKTQTLILKEQPNVHILYLTAWADSDNTVYFRKDIYERDRPLAEQLAQKPPV